MPDARARMGMARPGRRADEKRDIEGSGMNFFLLLDVVLEEGRVGRGKRNRNPWGRLSARD